MSFEQDLLRSAKQDRPSDESRAAAMAALGLTAAITTTAVATTVAKSSLLTTLKALPLAAKLATATLLLGLPAAYVATRSAPRAPVVVEAPTPAPIVVSAPEPEPEPVLSLPPPTPAPPPQKRKLAAPSSVVAEPAAPIDPLSRELALINRAESALRANDATSALARLDDHATLFPDGALAPEAGALHIEALLLAHRPTDAQTAATRWLAAHPTHPLAPRVRSLLVTP